MESKKDPMLKDNLATPSHHVRYARAWLLYQDQDISDDSRLALEREMDAAQNSFEWNEFQKFKKTLPGYVQFFEKQWLELIDLYAKKHL